jgi:hypothetical protein
MVGDPNDQWEADVGDKDIGPDPVPRPDEHPLEGGQTEAVDEAQDAARHDAADEPAEADPAELASMSASAARPGGGEQ